MNTDDIRILLRRYYDGETSGEEERLIKEFFLKNDVPEDLQADRLMFAELAGGADPEIPSGLDQRISSAIDGRARKHRTLRMRIFGGIAAMLCIILGLNAYITRYDDAITAKDTCRSPEEAAVQTERALMAFSKALKKGESSIDRAEQTTDKANKIIMEQLKKLNNR